MRVVIDTNVLVSGVFFGGKPRQVLEHIWHGEAEVFASPEIVQEYDEVVQDMIKRGQGHLKREALGIFLSCVNMIEPTAPVQLCRDPEDDKFLACADTCRAVYIVSGDKDLLELSSFHDIEIVTAAEFLARL